MDDMKTLEIAITSAGGVSALARLLGTSQAAVSNWRMRESVPAGWMAAIRMKFKRHIAPKPTKEAA